MSFSQHHMVTLLASLTSFLAALLVREASRNTCPSPHSHPQTLIAFAIDIALYAFVHHEIGKLPDVSGNTNTSAGTSRPSFPASPPYLCRSQAFWLTFVTLILLLLAGCTVCFGRRKDRMSGAASYPMSSYSKPSFFSRFRRNKA
jgi:hypothetical protein